MDDHAKSIKKQLRSLKKEAEYAKKLILNERKIDHLMGVLDKQRDHIVKQSTIAYEDNQSLIEN